MQNNLIDEIINTVEINQVIEKYVPLTKKGANYFGVCPFHDDTNPSMSVNVDKKIYKCFSCGAGGNVINFEKEYHQITWPEAIIKIAKEFQLTNGLAKFEKQVYKDKKDYFEYEVMADAKTFYHTNLVINQDAKVNDFLAKRGITIDLAQEFQIGLSPYQNNLYNYLLKKPNVEVHHLNNIKLFNQSQHDKFQGRIIFPIFNTYEQCIGFSGRTYEEFEDVKYINSQESALFKKTHVLYNMHRAKLFIDSSQEIIITEGFMDVIALYQKDIKNVVATMGTAFTKDHARLLKNENIKKALLLFDGDAAGQKAAVNAQKILISHNIDCEVGQLPNNLDIDDFLKDNNFDDIIWQKPVIEDNSIIDDETNFTNDSPNGINDFDIEPQNIDYNENNNLAILTKNEKAIEYMMHGSKEFNQILLIVDMDDFTSQEQLIIEQLKNYYQINNDFNVIKFLNLISNSSAALIINKIANFPVKTQITDLKVFAKKVKIEENDDIQAIQAKLKNKHNIK